MADEAKVSQVVLETTAALDGTSTAKVSQLARETVADTTYDAAKVSQIVLEMLSPANALTISQIVIETVAASSTPTNVEPTRPLEALAIHMGTGRYTMLTDLFPRWYESGIDPITGLPTLFYVNSRGVIFSPDWTQEDGGTTGHFYDMVGSGLLKTDVSSISGATLASMVITTPTSVFSVGGDGFKYSYPCMVYLARPQATVAPDTTNRYEIVAIGQAISNTADTITVDFTEEGSQVFFGATAGDLAAATSAWRVFVAPAVTQVWLPPLRDDRLTTLDDRAILESLGVQTGWSTDYVDPISGIDAADDGPVFPHALVMESKGYWPLDVPLGEGMDGLPMSNSAAAETETPRSIPLDPNMDNSWAKSRFAGHIVVPNLTQLSNEKGWDVELLGVVAKGIIEKGSSGVGPA